MNSPAPWLGAAPGSQPPIYLADLERCTPAERLADSFEPGRWRLLPYRAGPPAGGASSGVAIEGSMLAAGEESAAPEVAYPLGRSGWHHIYLGMFNGFWRPYQDQRIWVRLTPNPVWSAVVLPRPSSLPWGIPLDDDDLGPHLREVYWTTADVTGLEIHFRQPTNVLVPPDQRFGNRGNEVYLAYVKLVPLREGDARAVALDRADRSTRRLFAYNDSFTPFWDRGKWLPGDVDSTSIASQVEAYRHSDFGRIYWEGAQGDICQYRSTRGRMWTRAFFPQESFVRQGDRVMIDYWTQLLEAGIDPFAEACEAAHRVGLEFHATYRLGWGALYWPPPFDGFNQGGFYEAHPEWRSRRADGTLDIGLSFAYPQVRRFVLDLLLDLAAYPIDGVCLLFNRQPPFVGFEPVLVEAFRAETGRDPRHRPDEDEPWLRFRARSVTSLLRELRAELDALAHRTDRPTLPITAWVFGRADENLRFGLDVEAWIAEGLIQTVVPYSTTRKGFSFGRSWDDGADVTYWLELTRGTGCLFAPNILPRDMDEADHRRKALGLYRSGVEALAFWDTADRGVFASPGFRRLGHRAELEGWAAAGEPAERLAALPLKSVGDWDLSHLPE